MADRSDRHGWIDLLVPDGPFLSAAALDTTTVGDNWPSRLDAEQRALLLEEPASKREDDAGWDDSSWDGRRSRVEQLLVDLLGYREGKTLSIAPGLTARHHVYRAEVRADFVIHASNDPSDIRMVVICGPDATDDPERLEPTRTHSHDGWASTPVQRAALLARQADADLALVTTGREHLLVSVVTGTTGSAVWTVNSLEDRLARDAFVALLHKQRVLNRSMSVAKLIELSQDRQQELTDTLGKQVRRAAEALVNAISRANRTTHGRLLDGLTGHQVYAATTRVLMRTVFLLVAEERGLLPVAENQLYAGQYAMSTLLDKLEADAYRNRSAMERRSGAWQRMMALSRAVHSGTEHDELRLPAYGGHLFNPDEHPFLEARVPAGDGAELEQVSIGVVDDFTVLTVLRHLQVANGQRISFRSLDVEQIGHVYEALLDHSAVIVEESQVAVLGLIGKAGDEPEVPLVRLEAWSNKSGGELGSQLADMGVAAEARGVYTAIDDGLSPDSQIAQTLNVAVANDEVLRERVSPYAPLLRIDARGVALVFLPGDVYVTETSSKRDSGTAYTPRSLADEIAKHTLDPLIYDPGPQNESAESSWKVKSPEEILGLKICDPAVGSAAILVAAVRYLAEALLQARVETGELSPKDLASGASDIESVDARVQARRAIVSCCIYGIDRDPMAVEMAKLSLWLVTMARGEPFSFLDHAIQHGDSLHGVVSERQLLHLHLDPSRVTGSGRGQALQFGSEGWWEQIESTLTDIASLRQKIRATSVASIEDLEHKATLLARAHQRESIVKGVADAVTAACIALAEDGPEKTDQALEGLGPLVAKIDDPAVSESLDARTAQWRTAANNHPLLDLEFFHWPLAFPEVFSGETPGFDAVLGNPPFVKAMSFPQTIGSLQAEALKRYLAEGRRTNRADLVAFFFLRAAQVSTGTIGFIATSSVSEGDSQRYVMRPLRRDWTPYRADAGRFWPGAAAVHVNLIWLSRSWKATSVLMRDGDAAEVEYISSGLTPRRSTDVQPYTLPESKALASIGFMLNHSGFLLSDEDAALLSADPDSAELVRPVANAREALSGEWQRHVLDFGTMSEAEARTYKAAWRFAERTWKDDILKKAESRSYSTWADRWWQFWGNSAALRAKLEEVEQVILLPGTSKHGVPLIRPADVVYTHAVALIPSDDMGLFGLLHSEPHWWWVIERGSKMKADIRYSTSDCLATFPLPPALDRVRGPGLELADARQALEDQESGVTAALNRVNDPRDQAVEVQHVRRSLQALNSAVVDAYGWPKEWAELGFHDLEQRGTRWTVSTEAMNSILDALTDLNVRRHAERSGTAFETAMREAMG